MAHSPGYVTITHVMEDVMNLQPQSPELLAIDPLRDRGALDEAQVLDIRVDALSSVVGILLEMRTASLPHFTTGLLVVTGVTEFHWAGLAPRHPRTAWTITGWEIDRLPNGYRWSGDFFTSPDAHVSVSGLHGWFVGGNVPGISDAPPSYGEPDAHVLANIARWSSEIEILSVSSTHAPSEFVP